MKPAFKSDETLLTTVDHVVSSITRKELRKELVTNKAYLLCYRRRSPEPSGGASLGSPADGEASPPGEGKRLDDSSRNGLSSALPAAGAAHQAGDGGQTSEEENKKPVKGRRLNDSSRNGLPSAFTAAKAVDQAPDSGQTSEGDNEEAGEANGYPEEDAGYSTTRLPSYGPATIKYIPEDMLAPTVEALEDVPAEEMDMAIHNRPSKVIVDPELTVTHRSGRQPELYLGPLGPSKSGTGLNSKSRLIFDSDGWSYDPDDLLPEGTTVYDFNPNFTQKTYPLKTTATGDDANPTRNPSFQLIPLGGGYNMRPDYIPRSHSSSSAGSMDAAPPSPMTDNDGEELRFEDVLNPPEGFNEENNKSDSSDMDEDPDASPILVPDSDNTHLVISEDPDYWLAKKDQAPDFRPSTDPLDPTGRFIDPRNPPDIYKDIFKQRGKRPVQKDFDDCGFPIPGSTKLSSSSEGIEIIPFDPNNPDWDMSNVDPGHEESDE